jgi:transposase
LRGNRSGGERPIGQTSFPNTLDGVGKAAAWVMKVSKAEISEVHVVLESTAAHHELAARILAVKGMTVSLVNPAQIRSFATGMAVLSKTDQIDAVLLARYGCLTRLKAWTPPAEPLIELQALLARLDDLESDLRREQNRYEQACVRGCSGAMGRSVRGRPGLSKAGNSRLRAALYMAAVIATKLNPDIKAQQQRLLERSKAKMSTLGAAMRKLVHICFGVLKSGNVYQFPFAHQP